MKLFHVAGMIGQNQKVCVCVEDCAEQTVAIRRAVERRLRLRTPKFTRYRKDARRRKKSPSHLCPTMTPRAAYPFIPRCVRHASLSGSRYASDRRLLDGKDP